VVSFAKLPEQFGFCIQYSDTLANMRNYYPDFVVRLADNTYRLIETKGREDVDVVMKDQAARNWCDNVTKLLGVKWEYIKVPQKEYESMRPDCVADLTMML